MYFEVVTCLIKFFVGRVDASALLAKSFECLCQ
jgi:hypothetical protein